MSDISGDDTDVPTLRHKPPTNIPQPPTNTSTGKPASEPAGLSIYFNFVKSIGFRYKYVLPEVCKRENYGTTWALATTSNKYKNVKTRVEKYEMEKYETSKLLKPKLTLYYRSNGEKSDSYILDDVDKIYAGKLPNYNNNIKYLQVAPDCVYELCPDDINYRSYRVWGYANKLKMD